ncbi:hypothetical protein [Piscirickettsia litoralis]|uniref:hypothetical protein n=1 Tax=Piscirickettsia litoralis TaxID=1891921 RepID=UPI0022854EE1|nr:hypothetical protein [Piscirickettsia litoralis]
MPTLTAFFTYYLSLHGNSVHFAVFSALTISALTSLSNITTYLRQNLIKQQDLLAIAPWLLVANIVGLCCSSKNSSIYKYDFICYFFIIFILLDFC